jgi:hypothetical protein
MIDKGISRAIRAALTKEPQSPQQIYDAIEGAENGWPRQTVHSYLCRLSGQGRIAHPGRGLYCLKDGKPLTLESGYVGPAPSPVVVKMALPASLGLPKADFVGVSNTDILAEVERRLAQRSFTPFQMGWLTGVLTRVAAEFVIPKLAEELKSS